MQKNKYPPTLLLLLLALWALHSCQKSSFILEQQANPNIANQFFTNTGQLPATTQRIINLLQQKENRFHFVADFVKNQGPPLWQRSSFNTQPVTTSGHARNGTVVDTDTIVKIPLQLQGYPTVHGYLLCTISTDSVTVAVMDGRQYVQYGFMGNTANQVVAENLASEIMQFNYRIFGHQQFTITDNRLFGGDTVGNLIKTARLDSVGNNRNTGSRSILCPGGRTTVVVTTTQNHCPYEAGNCTGPGGSCDNCSEYCISTSSELYSFCNPTSTQQAPVWTLEQPGDPIGGGPVPLGWMPTPTDPCITTTNGPVSTTICGLGWTVGPNFVQEPISTVPDSIPNILARVCDRELDSVFNWGLQNNNREQGFILVRKNGLIYPKNYLPGSPNGDKTKINYLLAPGEELVGYVHTHPLPTLEERGSFSAEDFIELTKHRDIPGYTAILECGSIRYAFVIENLDKLNIFTSTRRNTTLKDGWDEAIINQPTIYTNPSLACENGIVQYLGTSSTCGVGFYKATAPNKTNFIKLNP